MLPVQISSWGRTEVVDGAARQNAEAGAQRMSSDQVYFAWITSADLHQVTFYLAFYLTFSFLTFYLANMWHLIFDLTFCMSGEF